jgi:hypothetical protein
MLKLMLWTSRMESETRLGEEIADGLMLCGWIIKSVARAGMGTALPCSRGSWSPFIHALLQRAKAWDS